jgi:tripartite-type tricarboxylate transporter receptor subunit TctC
VVLSRRQFLHLAASAAALPTVSRFAWAQSYPTRPVRFIVPFAAGGPTDVIARIFADLVSARWRGQPAIIENRPGAGTIVATAAVAKSPADGYTMLFANSAFFINPAIGQKLSYDTVKDFIGISTISGTQIALVANKSFPVNTVAELVA